MFFVHYTCTYNSMHNKQCTRTHVVTYMYMYTCSHVHVAVYLGVPGN